MAREYWICWNEGRTEGFITSDASDAAQCSDGMFENPRSTVGEAFREIYADDDEDIELQTERVVLPDLAA